MESAVVTILRPPEDAGRTDMPEEDLEPPVSFRAAVVSLEDSLMYLRAPLDTPVLSALKIETGDALWLGETEKCSPEGDAWTIRVRLHHVLRDFETLTRLAERFGTAAPKRISVQA